MRVTRFPARAEGLADRVAGFIAHLRMNGWVLGPAETAATLSAMAAVDATEPGQVRMALRALLAADADSWKQFEPLFDAYWFNTGAIRHSEAKAHVRTQSARPLIWQKHLNDHKGPDGGAEESAAPETPDTRGDDDSAEGTEGRLIATQTQALTRRDLRELMDDETLRAAEQAAVRLARAIRDRRSRRQRQATKGPRLDLRRTLRASVARGGEPLDLFRKRRPERPVRIVALADVSGSMTIYARPFLAFVRGLVGADARAEAFLFHTRLLRVTPALRDTDTLRAAGRLSLMAEGFGGGTDIGGSLAKLYDGYGRQFDRRTVVVILSDGYCTGTPGALAEALQKIHRRAGRIVWLNPLARWRDHAPVAAAMKAAAPHLDAHLPANTIEALAALEAEFAKL
ncbi:MAG: VWA domain-containing protein [Roseivivax sp.]|nr:VWA domain-containing protein [Roseivivax sp.]